MNFAAVRLLRANAISKQADDDVIRLTRQGTGIHVRCVHGNSVTNAKLVSELTLPDTSLDEYILTLAHGCSLDAEPYVALQVDFPGFPTLLYNIDQLYKKSVRKALRKLCYLVMTSWFADEAESDDDSSDDSSSTDSSTTATSSTSSSTDSDMPPLVAQDAPYHTYY